MLLPNSGASIAQFGAFHLHLAYHVSSFGYMKTNDLLYFFHVYLVQEGEKVYIGHITMPNTPIPDVMYWIEQRLVRQNGIIQELSTFHQHVSDLNALTEVRSADQSPLTYEEYLELKSGAEKSVNEAKQLYQNVERELAVLHVLYPSTSANDARNHHLGEFRAPPFAQAIQRTLKMNRQAWERETLTTNFILAPKIRTYGRFTVHPLRQRFSGIGEEATAYVAILLKGDSIAPIEVGVMGADESSADGTRQRIALCLVQFNYSINALQNFSNYTENSDEKVNALSLVHLWKQQHDVIESAAKAW